MTDSDEPTMSGAADVTTEPARPAAMEERRSRWRWLQRRFSLPLWAIIVVALVALGVGVGAGAAGGVQQSKYDAAVADLGEARQEVTDLKGEVADAKADAKAAEREASEKIEAEFASKNAALDDREGKLNEREQQLSVAEAAKKKDSIDGPGLYEVGVDINPGKWKTDGGSGSCYYAKLRSSDTSDIIDNNNVDGPAVVTLAAGQYFEVGSRCGPWQRVG